MPMAEITRDETSERARLLRVESYDVDLDLTGGPDVFRSVSVIRFGCTRPGAPSYADMVAETVHEISLNGAVIDPETAYGDGRIALTGLAERNELRVVADCAYGHGAGLQRSDDVSDGRTYLYSHFSAADARRVFANFEQPDLKAEFTFHVTAPDQWVVFSNQPAPEPVRVPGRSGAAVWHFPATPRISTYLTVLAAGDFHVVRMPYTTPGGQPIPLGLACRRSMAPFLDPDDIFIITRQGFEYYTDLFGAPYPFVKYDRCSCPTSPARWRTPAASP
jgi:aminopeptidase N